LAQPFSLFYSLPPVTRSAQPTDEKHVDTLKEFALRSPQRSRPDSLFFWKNLCSIVRHSSSKRPKVTGTR